MHEKSEDIRKESLRRLRRKAVIKAVACDMPLKRLLYAQEFTDRLTILLDAHRRGYIDDDLRDQGIEFLLHHKDPGAAEEYDSITGWSEPVTVTEKYKPPPQPDRCEDCAAAVDYPHEKYPGLSCFGHALFFGKPCKWKDKRVKKVRKKCPLVTVRRKKS